MCVYVYTSLSFSLSEIKGIIYYSPETYVNMQFLVYRGPWHSCFILTEKNGVTTATAIPPGTEAAPVYVALVKVH